jgi:hypothetical protein
MSNHLPQYSPPIVESVRCYCRRLYRVYVGCEDHQARFAEKEAAKLGAIFIDARQTPFVICACGQVLDFAPECVLTVQ